MAALDGDVVACRYCCDLAILLWFFFCSGLGPFSAVVVALLVGELAPRDESLVELMLLASWPTLMMTVLLFVGPVIWRYCCGFFSFLTLVLALLLL